MTYLPSDNKSTTLASNTDDMKMLHNMNKSWQASESKSDEKTTQANNQDYGAVFGYFLQVMTQQTTLYVNGMQVIQSLEQIQNDNTTALANDLNSAPCQFEKTNSSLSKFFKNNNWLKNIFNNSANDPNVIYHNQNANAACATIQTEIQVQTSASQNNTNFLQMYSQLLQQTLSQTASAIEIIQNTTNHINKAS